MVDFFVLALVWRGAESGSGSLCGTDTRSFSAYRVDECGRGETRVAGSGNVGTHDCGQGQGDWLDVDLRTGSQADYKFEPGSIRFNNISLQTHTQSRRWI
jgi:hypothetical protein